MSKVILVTGGTGGLGREVCRALLEASPRTTVLLACRDTHRGEQARVELLKELDLPADRLDIVQLDVTSEASVSAAAAVVQSRHGQLAGLVNNAGGLAATARATLELNLAGPQRVCSAFLPLLQPAGRVLNISTGIAQLWVAGCSQAVQRILADPSTTLQEVEQRLLHPFLEITEQPGLDREAAGAAVSALEFAPSRCPVGSWNDLEMAAYAFSKVGLNVFTAELARQWPGLRINALGAFHRREATQKVITAAPHHS